ncbi:MAG: NAD(P)/FAD-dependent oxidoreductase [Myxococcales bacterium]|nr:NAD(P)/FAD-dependent oxidoreductase [Myxococcales bacterium]
MSTRDPEAIVVGSGPNGLVAACILAENGYRVLLLEANPRRPGGALGSETGTLPGFVHDVGAAFFPFGKTSPAFKHLDLVGNGLNWCHAELESCHPAPDGSVAAISRDDDVTASHFGSPEDGATWRKLARWHRSAERHILGFLLGPFPTLGPLFKLGVFNLLKLTRILASSGRGLSSRLFDSEAARRVLPGLALHVDVGPDDAFGAALGYMLGLTAVTGGYPVPRGGAQAITDTLVRILESHGGKLRLDARVEQVITKDGRAAAVRLVGGEEIRASHMILANTSAPSLYLDLLRDDQVSSRVLKRMRSFPHGWGTFKLDWALDGPVPWSEPLARKSAVVHAGDSLQDLSRFTKVVRDGHIPDNPYMVIGQQSIADPTRAPDGKQTLWAYSRVPSDVEAGWHSQKERFADAVEARIEGLAPGFRQRILARRLVAPPDLQAMDANLVGGDLGGGSNAWYRQFIWRPVFPYFRYRTPVKGLYLCSSYAHPGAGVHGMCGFNAAHMAMKDFA